MKRMLLLLLLMCSVSTWAQDVIVKRDGTTIVCRVVEVSQTEVVYKRWTNLDGLNYVMNVSDLSAINYENGEKIRFDAQTQHAGAAATTPALSAMNANGQQTVSDDALLRMDYRNTHKTLSAPEKKAKRLKVAGWVTGSILLAGGAAMIGFGAVAGEDWVGNGYYGYYEDDADWAIIAPGIVLAVGGIATTSACLIRAHNIKKNASQYAVQSAPVYQTDFQFKNGTSLSAGVDMLKDNTRHNPTLGVGLTYNF